jgi:hypothetical protein
VASLTPQEKVKVRSHCGYLNVQEAQTFVMSVPAGVETQFIIEGAMDRILDAALPEVRRHIQILDSIEEQMVGDHELLAVEKLGEITVNTKEQYRLTQRYDYWVNSLCNLLGVYRNPFDRRIGGGGATGINAQVK